MDAYLSGPGTSRCRRSGPCRHPLCRLLLHLPVDSEVDARLARWHQPGHATQGKGGYRQRPPGLPGLSGSHHQPAMAKSWLARAEAAAPALGLHRVKNPAYPDTMYVTEPSPPAPSTPCPEPTLAAFADQRRGDRQHHQGPIPRCTPRPRSAGNHRVDFEDFTDQLEREGLAKFRKELGPAEPHHRRPNCIAATLPGNPDPAAAADRIPGKSPAPVRGLDLIRLLSAFKRAIRPCQSGRFHYLDTI